ncbi:MAG: transposase [Rhodocyclaceae bacterium]|nr:transposase [Rhodocyclaceae bacterium]
MPRRPRIHLAGLPLHIVQRGHNRDACFFGEDDYLAYRHWLGEALDSSGCRLHAYVLMTNHVHLLLTPPSSEAVSRLMISLGRRYVQYINKTYRRTGTLWDSRYKSSLVQADDYLLLCQRYIELNPVRAAMVDDPAHYRWSSYRANGLGQDDPLLTQHDVYLALGQEDAARLNNYRGLFRAELDVEAIGDIRMALDQGQPLGNSRFLASIEQSIGQRREVKPRGRPRKLAATPADAQEQLSIIM